MFVILFLLYFILDMKPKILKRRTFINVLIKIYSKGDISKELYIEILKGELENIPIAKTTSA